MGCNPHFCQPYFWASNWTVVLPAYTKTDNPHASGKKKATLSSQDTKGQDKQEDNNCPWERKRSATSKQQHKILLLLLTEHCKDPGELTLGRILILCWHLPVFLGFHLQASVQVVFRECSSGIYQHFPLILILVFPWLFKGPDSSLPENPSEPHQPWEGPSFDGEYGDIPDGVKGFDKTFVNNLFQRPG